MQAVGRLGRIVEPYLPLLVAPLIGLLLGEVVVAAAPATISAEAGQSRLRFRVGMTFGAVAIALAAVLTTPDIFLAWANSFLGWGLFALAWIDGRHFRLPDALTLPLLLLGLGAAWLLEPWLLTDRAAGAIFGYVAFRLIGWGYAAWRGQDGLGQGDAKLLAAGGAWVGAEDLSWVVMLAAIAGICWFGLRSVQGVPVTAQSRLPFGPFLALAIWTVRMAQVFG